MFKSGAKIPQTEITGNSREVDINLSDVMLQTITSLRNDLNSLKTKVGTVEESYLQMAKQLKRNPSAPWWPLKGVPIPASIFFIVWPVIIHILISWARRQKNRTV